VKRRVVEKQSHNFQSIIRKLSKRSEQEGGLRDRSLTSDTGIVLGRMEPPSHRAECVQPRMNT
jgi:hypothetical protein